MRWKPPCSTSPGPNCRWMYVRASGAPPLEVMQTAGNVGFHALHETSSTKRPPDGDPSARLAGPLRTRGNPSWEWSSWAWPRSRPPPWRGPEWRRRMRRQPSPPCVAERHPSTSARHGCQDRHIAGCNRPVVDRTVPPGDRPAEYLGIERRRRCRIWCAGLEVDGSWDRVLQESPGPKPEGREVHLDDRSSVHWCRRLQGCRL